MSPQHGRAAVRALSDWLLWQPDNRRRSGLPALPVSWNGFQQPVSSCLLVVFDAFIFSPLSSQVYFLLGQRAFSLTAFLAGSRPPATPTLTDSRRATAVLLDTPAGAAKGTSGTTAARPLRLSSSAARLGFSGRRRRVFVVTRRLPGSEVSRGWQ